MKKLIALSILALSGHAFTGSAIAQPEPQGWGQVTIHYKATKGDPFNRKDVSVHSVYTTDDTKTGVLIQCSPKAIGVYISAEPGNVRDIISGHKHLGYPRNISGRLIKDGDVVHEGPWVYYPRRKLSQSKQRKPAAKIFNAVVKGEKLSFKASNKPEVELSLPPIDDNFRDFNKKCREYWQKGKEE